jgi:hypothetical protein
MQRQRSIVTSIFLLVVALALALFLVGCGGDEAADETTTTVSTVPTTTSSTAPPEPFADLIGTTLELTDETPPDLKNSLETSTPVVVTFYVTGGTDDTAVLTNLDKVALKNADVDFYSYDYKTPDLYGDLAGALQVEYPPQVVFIDSSGVIQAVTSGFADEGTLNQLVTNIR